MSEQRVHYELLIDGRKLNIAPYSASLMRVSSQLTVASVRVLYPWALPESRRPPLPDPGAPVELRWGIAPQEVRTWWGYLHHAVPDHDHPEGSYHEATTYVLVGTGHVMETQHTRDWRKITDSGIAQKIAEEYGFSLVAHKTSRIHDYLLQPGVSDLDWLRMRAQQCGRRVHVENGTLYFIDPASLAMARSVAALPAVMHKGREAERVVDVEPLYGSLVPIAGKQAKRALTGFDIDTNKLIAAKQVPGVPAPDFVARDTAITSPTDLYTKVDAVGVEHEEWLKARVAIRSYSHVDHLPGQLIDLQGNAVPPLMRGPWLIVSATHHLESHTVNQLTLRAFDSQLVVARNTPSAFRVRDRRTPRVDDACMLSGGRWRARNRRVVIL